ncbi:MAG: hypothetical protein AAFV53_17150 [Myxococcota bacterium]
MRLPPPPRHLSASLWVQLLIGSAASQLAVFIFAFFCGTVAFFIFDSELVTPYDFPGPITTTTGEVLETELTADDYKTMRIVRYRYTVDQQPFEGVSYALPEDPVPEGTVTVEVLPQRPERSRIQGLQRRRYSAWILVVVIPPMLAVLSFLFLQLQEMRQTWQILRMGAETTATIVSVEDRGVVLMTPRQTLRLDNGRHAKTWSHHHFAAEQTVSVLLDPSDSERAMVWAVALAGIQVDAARLKAMRGPVLPLLGVAMSLLFGAGLFGLAWFFVLHRPATCWAG